jgi:biopolymer transport protein ExbD
MNSQHPDSGVDSLWLAKRQEKKANRRKRKPEQPVLMITSLMDAFTIILVFLLKSFGSDPVQIRESDDLKLPRTTSEKTLEDAVVIGISTKAIQVDDRKVADLRNGMIDESLKRDGADGLLINPLFDQLQERVQHLKMVAARTGSEFKSKALIVADKGTNYRVITEVLYTAGQAEFNNFLFVAAEGSKQE